MRGREPHQTSYMSPQRECKQCMRGSVHCTPELQTGQSSYKNWFEFKKRKDIIKCIGVPMRRLAYL